MAPEMLAEAVERRLFRPAMAYRTWPVAETGPDWMRLECGARFTGAPDLAGRLGGATEVTAIVSTIGAGLDRAVAELFARKKALRALVLEEIGIAALYNFTDAIVSFIGVRATARGLEASSPIHPGNAGFDLSQQALVFELAAADRAGVRLATSGMMDPVKSVSMVVGLGERMPRWSRFEECDSCKARQTCRYRYRGQRAVPA